MTEEIEPEDALLRRVRNDPNLWTETEGQLRVSSAAMSPHPEDARLSVDARKLIPDPNEPLTAPCRAEGDADDGLAEFFARIALELGLAVHHDPQANNAAHVNITGFDALGRKQAKRVQRELAKASTWVREPAGVASP